jgi:ABC-type uncharacterized transport system permease subunit
MNRIIDLAFIIGWLAASIRLATPLLVTSLGQVFTQRSGVLDMAVEAYMTVGALTGFAGAYYFGSPWLGVLTGLAGGMLVGLIAAFFYVTLGSDQVITGVILVIMTAGLTIILNRIAFGGSYIPPQGTGFEPIHIPVLSELPMIGPILFQQNPFTYMCWLMAPIAYLWLNRTTVGLSIKAVGEKPMAADSVGINVGMIRYGCTLVGAATAGLGGTFLSLGYMNMYVTGISAGRGWIALALVIFSQWNPLLVMLGALFFGAVEALQLRFQSGGIGVAPQLLQMLPYILTVLALVLISRRGVGPAALGTPYKKEHS